MQDLVYGKACNAGKLSDELISAGFLKYPTANYKFFGISTVGSTTTVHVIDGLSQADQDAIAAAVTAHTNTAWGQVSQNFLVKTFEDVVLVKEEWFATDNGNGTYSGKAREIVYTYSTSGKLIQTVEKLFWSDGTVRDILTTNHFTNLTANTRIEKRA